MLHIYVDADACPVKDETYRVAERYDLAVTLVSDNWMRVPARSWIHLEVVKGDLNLDVADDWIAEHAEEDDIVITADIPLASRCLEKGAVVLGPRGRPFTEDSIGEALATRELLSGLRDMGEVSGGPPPFGRKDRSRYLHSLDEAVHKIRRRRGP